MYKSSTAGMAVKGLFKIIAAIIAIAHSPRSTKRVSFPFQAKLDILKFNNLSLLTMMSELSIDVIMTMYSIPSG